MGVVPGPVTVKVVPVMVAGSIASLKPTVIVFSLIGTPWPPQPETGGLVEITMGVGPGVGVAVGVRVGVGIPVGVGVDLGVEVGFGVLVGLGLLVGFGVLVGLGVLAGLGVLVAFGVLVGLGVFVALAATSVGADDCATTKPVKNRPARRITARTRTERLTIFPDA